MRKFCFNKQYYLNNYHTYSSKKTFLFPRNLIDELNELDWLNSMLTLLKKGDISDRKGACAR